MICYDNVFTKAVLVWWIKRPWCEDILRQFLCGNILPYSTMYAQMMSFLLWYMPKFYYHDTKDIHSDVTYPTLFITE